MVAREEKIVLAKRDQEKYQKLQVGVLALQGAVSEHVEALEKCGARALAVRKPEQLKNLDGLIIPGGESTTIGRLSRLYGYDKGIYRMAAEGKPVFGTCAGLVLLAKRVEGQEPLLGLMDITARRNAYGRQRESFEADLEITVLGREPFRGVFIRAPIITSVGENVQVLCSFQGNIVAAREQNLLACSFHPELTGDLRFHLYFLQMALLRKFGKGRGLIVSSPSTKGLA